MKYINLLSDLIAIDTVNDPKENKKPSPEIIKHVEGFISGFLEEKLRTFQVEDFWSIEASFGSNDGPHILFLGHLDVVPYNRSAWKTNPLQLEINESGIARGRGVQDCKGGCVALLKAFEELSKEDITGKITLVLTTDEEIGGRRGAGFLADEMQKKRQDLPDAVINCDGSFVLTNRRRGAFKVHLRVPPKLKKVKGSRSKVYHKTRIVGKQTLHSAYFQPGADIHALIAASKELSQRKNLRISKIYPENFTKGNILPEEVQLDAIDTSVPEEEAQVDENLTRALVLAKSASRLFWKTERPSTFGIGITPNILEHSNDQGTYIEYDVRAMTSDSNVIKKTFIECYKDLDNISVDVLWGGGYVFTPNESPLLIHAREICKKQGINGKLEEQEGATDSRYFSSKGVPCLDFGVIGGNIHGHNEWIELSSIERCSSFYKELGLRLLQD